MKDNNCKNRDKTYFDTPIIQNETLESLSAKLLQATSELTDANRQLHAIQKEREEMMSNLSHDLRAPITAIRSAIDYLLVSDNLTIDDYKASISMIDRRTHVLEDLIQDMYYLFCVEDTSKQLQLAQLSIGPFLEEYYYDTLTDSRFDTHRILLEVPEDLIGTVSVDVPKFVRVLDNLFNNALKYTPADSTITLRAELSGNKDMVLISVLDNGPGIPQNALPNIFNRTYTVSDARTPGENSSSGLGLAIVKAIMDRHGGTISCTSEINKGSCFILALPTVH